jgi:uncharacterized protein YbjT (DUF2867 family)
MRDHDAQAWFPRLRNIDAVINCVGIIREQGRQTFEALHTKTPRALFKACKMAGVKKVIQISALGADASAFSEYHLSKKAADDCLASLHIDWTILMPSIVYGQGAKSMEFFKALAALPFTPLVDKGDQPIQPIHIDDLCLTVAKALNTDQLSHQRIEVLGPEPIAMRDMYTLLKTWLGIRHSRFIPIPYGLSLIAARFGGLMGNTPITRDTVQMLKKGNTGNAARFVEITGIIPRSFEKSIMTSPPLPSEAIHATHFFLLPITLALLWIMTGYISAFVYPRDLSLLMLEKVGIGDALAPLALYSAAALDFGLGVSLLIKYQVRLVAIVQIVLMITYSILITIGMPELWTHPFGPVTKNIPVIAATLVILAAARR